MLDVEVLYLKRDGNSTNIVKVQKELIVNDSIYNIINIKCLKLLTTIEGRVEAIKQVYKIFKFVPIYINEGLILQPIYNSKAWNQIYINICNIKKVNEVNDRLVITFINEKTIYLDISLDRMKRYLKKCLKIKENQIKLMKEEKYYG